MAIPTPNHGFIIPENNEADSAQAMDTFLRALDGLLLTDAQKTALTTTLAPNILHKHALNNASDRTIDGLVVTGTLRGDKGIVFDEFFDLGNSGTAKAVNWTLGNKQKITLTGNCTLTFTPPEGACTLTLLVKQDGTGGRSLTFPAAVKWSNGVPLATTPTAGKTDIVSILFDGTNYYAAVTTNF